MKLREQVKLTVIGSVVALAVVAFYIASWWIVWGGVE